MKKLVLLLLPIVTAIFVSAAGAQSLADIAAQTRVKQKANPNAKVIDNDLLPSAADADTYRSPYESAKDEAATGKDSAKGNDDKDKKEADRNDPDKDKKEADKGKKEEDKKAAEAKIPDALKKQIADEQKEVAQLQRELDVAQREARLRAAAYYADAGTMLRDQGKFAEDTRKTQAEIDAKTQALAAAKEKLGDLQEQARKAGMPSSEVESAQNNPNPQSPQ